MVASRSTMSSWSSAGKPAPAWLVRIAAPTTSRAPTTAAPKSSATYGLRRVGWILANTDGTTSSRAIPYRMRAWATTVTSVVLLMAIMAISAKTTSMIAAGMKNRSAR